jgi:hypothetical protein
MRKGWSRLKVLTCARELDEHMIRSLLYIRCRAVALVLSALRDEPHCVRAVAMTMTSPQALSAGAVTVEDDGGLAVPLLADGSGATKTEEECGAEAEGKYWVAADEAERQAVTDCGAEDGRALLFRTYKLRGAILHPYRYLCTHAN